MFRVILKLSLFLVVSSFVQLAFAAPFSNADAFKSGDYLAMRDNETGLIWLDFGVNNGQSFNSVINELDTVYREWRLPSEAEVFNLWKSLSASGDTKNLMYLFDIWGKNVGSEQGFDMVSWGFYLDDDGYLGALSLIERNNEIENIKNLNSRAAGKNTVNLELLSIVVDRKYDGSNYYPFNADGISEISTLLVRRSFFFEASPLTLILTGLLCLGLRRGTASTH